MLNPIPALPHMHAEEIRKTVTLGEVFLAEYCEQLRMLEEHMQQCSAEYHWAERAALLERIAAIEEELQEMRVEHGILEN